MNNCVMQMPSYTYAVKAAKLLNSRNIESKVIRSSKKCGYSVAIYGRCSDAADILNKYSIPFTISENEPLSRG
ncbi:MAG: DUF3343 domain-containing protein [Ruminococcus sp.]|nr:DUF3343 domain-containing protein [Ruminococcus sp.]